MSEKGVKTVVINGSKSDQNGSFLVSFLIPLKSSFYLLEPHKCQKKRVKKVVKKCPKWVDFDPFLVSFLRPLKSSFYLL